MDTNENDKNSASSISSDLIRGHINTIILRTLYDGDKYGYEIINEIEEKSRHQYSLKQPTLYSALKRLESQDYITSYWGGASAGGRRKYFQITEKGRKIVEQNLAEWEYSRTVIDSLISQKDYDFNNPPPTGGVDFNVLKKTTTRVPIIKGEDEDDYDFSDFEGSPEEKENHETYAEPQDDTVSDEDTKVSSAEQKATQADESLSREDLNGISGGYSPVSDVQPQPEQAYSAEYDTVYEYTEPTAQAAPAAHASESATVYPAQEPLSEQPNPARAPDENAEPYVSAASVQQDASFRETPPAQAVPTEQELTPLTEQEKQRIHENYQALIGDDTDATSYYFSQVARKDKGQRYTEKNEAAYSESEAAVYPQEPLYQQPSDVPLEPDYLQDTAYQQNEPEYAAQDQNTADLLYANKSPAERNYKSLLSKLYENTQNQPEEEEQTAPPVPSQPVQQPEPQQPQQPQQPQPQPAPTPEPAKTASNVEFYDLEEKAENEGLKITTSNGSRSRASLAKAASGNTFDKGRVMFITAVVVFAVALIESIINICLKSTLSSGDAYVILPFVFDFVMLGVFLFLYLRGYGKNSRKTQSRSYLSASFILYANLVLIICVIAYLIIWFGEANFTFVQVLKYAIFPCIYVFNIPLFALLYNYNCNKQ